MDFCAHSHFDRYNMPNGSTIVSSSNKFIIKEAIFIMNSGNSICIVMHWSAGVFQILLHVGGSKKFKDL